MKKFFVAITAVALLQACSPKQEPPVANTAMKASEGKGGVDGFLSGAAHSTKVEQPATEQKGGTDGFLSGGTPRSRFVESGKKKD